MGQRVERAGLDQRFDGALVADHGVDLAQEVGEVGERGLGLAGRHDRGDHVRADVAHRGQPEPDVGSGGGEVGVGGVDVGRQHLDAHSPALGQVDGRLFLVVLHRGEQRGHVLGRVIGLQVGRPIRHHGVPGAVTLVEAVLAEGQQRVPQRLDRPGREPALGHAGGERLVLGVQLLLLLLAHRSAQQVGAGK